MPVLFTNPTSDENVRDVIRKRFIYSLDEIEDLLAGILDQVTIDQREVIRFVASLPCIKPCDLGPASEDQTCSICLTEYGDKYWSEKKSLQCSLVATSSGPIV